VAAAALWLVLQSQAPEVIYQESFETDGEGTRYTTEGSNVYEPARIGSELNRLDQIGPVYWARKSKVSVVGIPETTPARRALMCWSHNIAAAAVTRNSSLSSTRR